MKRKRIINISICIAAVIVFLAVCRELYLLRYRGSDIYPQFSSLRSDPFGTKVLYLSLERSGAFDVSRSMRSLDEINNTAGHTVLIIGAHSRLLQAKPDILNFALRGGRVVLCYSPFLIAGKKEEEQENPFAKMQRKIEKDKLKKPKLPDTGLKLERHVLPPAFPAKAKPTAAVKKQMLSEFDFYSAWYFIPDAQKWQTLYTLRGKPVMVRRKYGSGDLLLCSDSFLLSNEGMSGRPSGELLMYLLGENKKILFEETHLGSYHARNVAWLIYRYNLQWFLLALALAAGLYIWRSLMTPSDSTRPVSEVPEETIDNDSLAAPAGLFRRDYSARELPQLCMDEFLQSGPGKRLNKHKCDQMKAECQLNKPLDAYNACVRVYKTREKFKG